MVTAEIRLFPFSVSPQKMEGVVKFYCKELKCGLITLKHTNSYILVHENTLIREGVEVAQGQRVRFRVFSGGGCLTACNIEVLGSQTKSTTDMIAYGEWYYGNLKWYDPNRGFGFVTLDKSGEDAFLHATVLRKLGFNTDQRMQNKRVSVQIDQGSTDPVQVIAICFI